MSAGRLSTTRRWAGDTVSWRQLILAEMERNGDAPEAVISEVSSCNLEGRQDTTDIGYEEIAFTVWTSDYVYFPAGYDGTVWCESIARNPGYSSPKELVGEGCGQ